MGWDSHCHLQLDPLYEEVEFYLSESAGAGVEGCLVPAYGAREWKRQERLLRHPNILLALGLHPWCVPNATLQSHQEALQRAFRDLPPKWGARLRAVGEFGLDRLLDRCKDRIEDQNVLFVEQLKLAERVQLPVILHVVKAHGMAVELLESQPLSQGGVLHSYSGAPEMVERYARLGLSFSFSGNLFTSGKARESLAVAPVDRILWETDGPEGPGFGSEKPVVPAFLPRIVEKASQILGKSIEWCWSCHQENFKRIFGPINS